MSFVTGNKRIYLMYFIIAVTVGVIPAVLVRLSGAGWSAAVFTGGLIGCFYFWLSVRRPLRRAKLLRQPFPEAWRDILIRHVPFYRKLDPTGRNRFENNIRIFLDEQRIYGVRGAAVSDEIKVLIGASAAMLAHGLPNWEWPHIRDIIVYPANFDETYNIVEQGSMSGVVHQQGPIIFSETELKHGFQRPDDGRNVGLHELAHVMDMAGGEPNGIPAGLSWVAAAPWVRIMADRIRKIRRSDTDRVLRSYAGVNEAEFFAVAVEVFFEQPEKLRKKDAELYRLLSAYFQLDPGNPASDLTPNGST